RGAGRRGGAVVELQHGRPLLPPPPLLRAEAAQRPVLALPEPATRRAAAPVARPAPGPPRRRPLPLALGPAARPRDGGGARAVGAAPVPAPGVLRGGLPARLPGGA